MNSKFKWAIALIIIGILFTIGGAVSKILHYSGSNKLLITALVAHLSGIGLVLHDVVYTRKLN